MTDHDDHVPPSILDELSVAFGTEPPPRDPVTHQPDVNQPEPDRREAEQPSQDHPVYDLDDPNIDVLLGIAGAPAEPAHHSAEAAAEPAPADPLIGASTPPPTTLAHQSDGAGTDTPSGGDAGRRTIVIEETDQPDAMYLDEEAEQRLRQVHGQADDPSATTTIVIGDADDGRPTAPVPTTSRPPIDPRVRARRIAVGRAKGRRRLVIGGALIGLVAVIIGGLAVLGSSWFSVERIDIQGAAYSRADVERVVASTKGEAVLLVDTVALERRLEAIPWVESATVDTDFPHGLFVDVRERRPVAYFVGSDGKARAIDRDARVLAVLNGLPTEYPRITGTAPDTEAGRHAGAVFQGAVEVVMSLPPELSSRMVSVGVDSAAGVVTMKMKGGAQVRLGPPTDLTKKLARLLLVVRQPGFAKLKLIDVSTSDVSTK